MRNKNGFSTILILPILVLIIVVLGAFAYKLNSDRIRAQELQKTPMVTKVIPPLQTAPKKPTVGYGVVPIPVVKKETIPEIGIVEPQIGSNSATVDLETLINETDDAAAGDLNALDSTASGL
jgi:hypothetical protein